MNVNKIVDSQIPMYMKTRISAVTKFIYLIRNDIPMYIDIATFAFFMVKF